jgi:hypothetical protein
VRNLKIPFFSARENTITAALRPDEAIGYFVCEFSGRIEIEIIAFFDEYLNYGVRKISKSD